MDPQNIIMQQTQLPLDTQTLHLPEIVMGPIRYPCGTAQKLIRVASEAKVVNQEEIKISPKVSQVVLTLDTGERVIVTDRKKYPRPEQVDGVLFESETKELSWHSHRLLDEMQDEIESNGLGAVSDRVTNSWKDAIRYKAETEDEVGLRPPQLGALFAIGSHWSLHNHPATIVMPTGTGKTETMLATAVAHQINRLLVAVPSKALRSQISDKFLRLGLLQQIGVVADSVDTPVVGVVTSRPKSEDDLQIFKDCNVIVGTVSSLADGTAAQFIDDYPELMQSLIVDEAHHVPASTWTSLKTPFSENSLLQFTATPFRNDGKLVDGTVIYSYPLKAAQDDDYFKEIDFLPVHQLDDDQADETIAIKAIERLRGDLAEGRDHLLMARCRTTARAEAVQKIYERLAPDLNPLLIHSELKEADERVAALRSHQSRIVVCVNMLGEGVDIPSLKVAAVHDKHQSLAVLLQFIGRFTRKGEKNLGNASVVANTADPKISLALEELYNEDADWNSLLREMSSEAAKEHAEFIKFLEESTPFELDDDELSNVSHQSLRPVFSTLFYKTPNFRPKKFIEGLSDRYDVVRVWINEQTQTLYFVTRSSEKVRWTNAKDLKQVEWHLFVLHHDPNNNLLFLASTNKDSTFEGMAKAVGATKQISGEEMFRTLGRIGRLVFNNLGVTKHGRRNLSFAMYTGADVRQALSETEKKGSRKSNISGYGWENGKQITIGCSYRGRVWSKAAGTLPAFIRWAEHVGAKLVDDSIDTKSVIANVLIPEYAAEIPNYDILNVEWPTELFAFSEDKIQVEIGSRKLDWLSVGIDWQSVDRASNTIEFVLVAGQGFEPIARYTLTTKGEDGFEITELSEPHAKLVICTKEYFLRDYFAAYPPLVRFVDLSELDGNVLLKAEDSGIVPLPPERLEAWDWSKTDIKKESIWKAGVKRLDSIQWAMAEKYREAGFSVIFDDDGKNEAADLICLKEEEDHIRLVLIHCKFSGKSTKGGRVKDVVEVASQAVRSARWPGKFKELVRHIQSRNKSRIQEPGRSLFLAGSTGELNGFLKASRFKEVRPEIVIVQPGVTKAGVTQNQSAVLGSAVAFLKQTLNVDVDVICSD